MIGKRVIALLGAACLLATGGCGAATKESKSHAAKVVAPTGHNGDLKGKVTGEIKSLKAFSCKRDVTGAWNAKATVKNEGGSARRYLVTVSVTKAKTSQVIGSAEKMLEIAPGKTGKVVLAKFYADDRTAKGRLCVPRVVSGT
jgi:hypothetical protein